MSIDTSSWTIERDYPHPPERVLTAWADPRAKVRWFDLSGQDHPDYHSDFRVGGTERFRTPVGARPAHRHNHPTRQPVHRTEAAGMNGERELVDGRV